nr:ribonuclease H-like domain-containing protein [Tanacetum cinerariifolium]
MRPFGCPVTILNTLDPLDKFDGKADEVFFDGYTVNSKAFRVFNSRTRIVEETLHITFLENKPIVAGSTPTWLFDIDTLTKSMNYKPVVVENQSNGSAGKGRVETEKKDVEDLGNEDNEVLSTEEPRVNQEKDVSVNNTNNINTVSLTANAASIKDNVVDENIIYECADHPICLIWMRLSIQMMMKMIEATRLFLAYVSFKDFVVYQIDVKSAFMYGKIEEEVYVCQHPEFPNRVYKVEKALYGLHQAPRA